MKVKINNNVFEVENDVQFWQNISKWEPYSFEILDRFLKDGGTFVDVGAWNGVLSIYGATKATEVHSFEPDKVAFQNFTNNIKLNGINNIKAHNAAASFEHGINKIVATLEPYYNCFNVHFEKFSYEEFRKSLHGRGHCFIFVKK